MNRNFSLLLIIIQQSKLKTMRFKITLQVNAKRFGREIPINYQYELSAAIYHMMAQSSIEYSTWLHENGYAADQKRFKLFAFSHLIVPNYGINKERQRLIIQSDVVEWYITFLPEKSTRSFIEGVFKQQSFQVGDKESVVEFTVCSIQVITPLEYEEEMCFRTLSPVCISCRQPNGKIQYLSPSDQQYIRGIQTGLLARYKAYYNQEYNGPVFCSLQLLNEPRSNLLRIKSGTEAQTFIRGYQFSFKLKLPVELMRIAYEGGLGEKSSLGFGMIEKIPHHS